MKALDRNIWRSSITTATKICLQYSATSSALRRWEWTLTKVVSKKIDSFDLWCQRRILRVHYSHHISNCEIRNRTGCTPATDIIRRRQLQLFGHTARSEPEMDTVVLYVPQFEDRLLTGNDLQGDQDRLELLKTIWNLPTSVCTPRGGERKIVLTGGTSSRQQRSTRGMLLMMMIVDENLRQSSSGVMRSVVVFAQRKVTSNICCKQLSRFPHFVTYAYTKQYYYLHQGVTISLLVRLSILLKTIIVPEM